MKSQYSILRRKRVKKFLTLIKNGELPDICNILIILFPPKRIFSLQFHEHTKEIQSLSSNTIFLIIDPIWKIGSVENISRLQ